MVALRSIDEHAGGWYRAHDRGGHLPLRGQRWFYTRLPIYLRYSGAPQAERTLEVATAKVNAHGIEGFSSSPFSCRPVIEPWLRAPSAPQITHSTPHRDAVLIF